MSLVGSAIATAMAMDVDALGLDYSGRYSTTTEYDDEFRDLSGLDRTNWDWPPLDDWEHLVGQNDLDLIESMMDDGGGLIYNLASGASVEEGSPHSESTSTELMTVDDQTNDDNRNGLRLVHLLIAAADALSGANRSRDQHGKSTNALAQVILFRLKGLVSPADGTNMERLAAYFTEAMQALLDGDGGVHPKHLITHRDDHHPQTCWRELLE